MGGSSGIVTGDTKEEVRQLVTEWYKNWFKEYQLYPRLEVKDFPANFDFEGHGYEIIDIEFRVTDRQSHDTELLSFKIPIAIQPLKEFQERASKFFDWLNSDQKQQNFGCFVTAHA